MFAVILICGSIEFTSCTYNGNSENTSTKEQKTNLVHQPAAE